MNWQVQLYKEQAWTIQSDQDEDEDTSDDSVGEDNWNTLDSRNSTAKPDSKPEEYYCVICGKRFKSAKQWQNHEKSKKHIENVTALKGAFQNDDEQVEMLGRHLGIDVSGDRSKQKEVTQDEQVTANVDGKLQEEVSSGPINTISVLTSLFFCVQRMAQVA